MKQSTISEIERGQREHVSLKSLVILCKALKITLVELFKKAEEIVQ
ncbi:helix-turn-helix domain-containing protein [Candidatus Riflebacteria bacterium]